MLPAYATVFYPRDVVLSTVLTVLAMTSVVTSSPSANAERRIKASNTLRLQIGRTPERKRTKENIRFIDDGGVSEVDTICG